MLYYNNIMLNVHFFLYIDVVFVCSLYALTQGRKIHRGKIAAFVVSYF